LSLLNRQKLATRLIFLQVEASRVNLQTKWSKKILQLILIYLQVEHSRMIFL